MTHYHILFTKEELFSKPDPVAQFFYAIFPDGKGNRDVEYLKSCFDTMPPDIKKAAHRHGLDDLEVRSAVYAYFKTSTNKLPTKADPVTSIPVEQAPEYYYREEHAFRVANELAAELLENSHYDRKNFITDSCNFTYGANGTVHYTVKFTNYNRSVEVYYKLDFDRLDRDGRPAIICSCLKEGDFVKFKYSNPEYKL